MKLSTQAVSCRFKKKITNNNNILAGFGKACITPSATLLEEGIHLGSQGDEESRVATGVLDDIYALTVALTDTDGNTLLLIVTDLTNGNRLMTAKVREAVSEKYGIPAANVMVAGTHNHSSIAWPSASKLNAGTWTSQEVNETYTEEWLEGVMASVEEAMKDRSEATLQIGKTYTTENASSDEKSILNFSRRYVKSCGCYTGTHSSWWGTCDNCESASITAHESDADSEIQMLRLVRKNDKDILLTQWQAHAAYLSGNKSDGNHYKISAEWPGVMRDTVETELEDVHCVYFQGAAANMSVASKISGETKTTDYKDHGEQLAQYVIDAYNTSGTFSTVNAGKIQTNQTEISAENGTHEQSWKKSYDLQVNAISIGDLALVTLPQELFDCSGQQIKANTAHKMTLIMGYSDCTAGYLAPSAYVPNGGYEVLNTAYAVGITTEDNYADIIVDHYLTKLKELAE